MTYMGYVSRLLTLGAVICAVLRPEPPSSITVVASSYIGEQLLPTIHLYQLGSRKDFWPAGRSQSAANISHGYYELEVSYPGYRSFNRGIELGDEHMDVRVILIPSDEAQGAQALTGRVVNARDFRGLWVIVFPLAGSPSDTTECLVSESGHFRIATAHSGPYVLTVVRGQTLLSSQAVNIGIRTPELTIDLRE